MHQDIRSYIRPAFWAAERTRRFRVMLTREKTLITWRTPEQVLSGMGTETGVDELTRTWEESRSYVEAMGYPCKETKHLLAYLDGAENPPDYDPNPPPWMKSNRNFASTVIYMRAMSLDIKLTDREQFLVDRILDGSVRSAFDYSYPVDFNAWPATIPRMPSSLPPVIKPKNNTDLLMLAALFRNYNL